MDLRESGNRVSFSITSIMSSLVSAILEWILMFMIFVDSSFAYLVTRFAHRSQLQTPCLLCSRLDHILGNHREGFYWDLICHSHKSKISSLVLCRLHNNLVDAHRMCETCISSFTKSDSEAYRLLVGKLGTELDDNIDSRKCLCCNEQWISRTSIQNLFDRGPGEAREIAKESDKGTDSLPHVEYSQIKVTSDTESDNENLIHEMETSGQGLVAKYDSTESQITALVDCPPAEKLIHLASPITISLSESEDHTFSNHNVVSERPIGHGVEELHWKKGDRNDDVSRPSELASSHGVHPSSNANDTNYIESNETSKLKVYCISHCVCYHNSITRYC